MSGEPLPVDVAIVPGCPSEADGTLSACQWRRAAWAAHDATLLMRQAQCPFPGGILIDQGEADTFLAEQLYPDDFAAACAAALKVEPMPDPPFAPPPSPTASRG